MEKFQHIENIENEDILRETILIESGLAKLNIDENEGTPPKYGIRGIPTLMIFKDGQVKATKVGALAKSQLTAFIDSNI